MYASCPGPTLDMRQKPRQIIRSWYSLDKERWRHSHTVPLNNMKLRSRPCCTARVRLQGHHSGTTDLSFTSRPTTRPTDQKTQRWRWRNRACHTEPRRPTRSCNPHSDSDGDGSNGGRSRHCKNWQRRTEAVRPCSLLAAAGPQAAEQGNTRCAGVAEVATRTSHAHNTHGTGKQRRDLVVS